MERNCEAHSGHPSDVLPGVCEFLEIKREALRVFLNSTLELKEALREENRERAEALIEEREACIRKINVLDERLKAHTERHPGFFTGLSPEGRLRISHIAEGIEEILDQVNAINKECIASAVRQLKQIEDEMTQTVRNRREMRGLFEKSRPAHFLNVTT
jgi:uncharacterized coiled-coil DUF342 family protein